MLAIIYFPEMLGFIKIFKEYLLHILFNVSLGNAYKLSVMNQLIIDSISF